MRPLEFLALSWRAIRGHPLRSALTTLGIVIGIAAVIVFVALGASLQAGLIGDISPDDQRNLYGWAADPDTEGGPAAGAQPVFSQDDVDAVSELEAVDEAYGYASLQSQAVEHDGDEVAQGDGLISAGPSYIREERLDEGRQFEMGEREAVVNPAAAGQFESEVAVGDELTVTYLGGQSVTVEVVGITDTDEGLSPFEGFESSPRVYLPTDPHYVEQTAGLGAGAGEGGAGAAGGEAEGGGPDDGADDGETTDDAGDDGTADDGETADDAGDDDGARYVAIVVEAESADEADVDRAREAASDYLESDDADASELLDDDLAVELQTSTELLQQLEDILELLRDFIVGIAAISLVVGSIGIANIMLVSVTERTREIGIMKAVGATNRDVLGLFLAESIVLGVVGAVLGTALGFVGGYLGARFVDVPLVYPVEYVLAAIGVGIVVGVVSGLYPAWRAARTDPIDALRYE